MQMPNSDAPKLGLLDVSPSALLSGAIVIAVLSVTPYVNILNLFLGIGIVIGGVLTAKLIKQLDGIDLAPSEGFKFGAWSGLFGAIATVIAINAIASFGHYDVTQAQIKFVANIFTQDTAPNSSGGGVGIGPYYVADANGDIIPAESLNLENLDRNIWVDFGITIPLFVLFAGIGGALAASATRKKRR